MIKFLTALAAVAATFCAYAGNGPYLGEYGVQTTFDFVLYNSDGTLDVDEVDSGTEVVLFCDEGDADGTTATNDFADETNFYSITLTAAEMQCARIAVDVGATVREVFFVYTMGNSSGEFTALPANVTQWLSTAAATPTVAGVPEVDVTHWIATAAATPTTAGVPEVDLTYVDGDATAAANLEAFLDLIVNTANGAFPPYGISASGTAVSYTAGTPEIVLAAATAAADNDFNDQTITAWGDAGELHSQCVADFTGASDAVTLDAAFNTAPAGTIRYVIWATTGCAQGGTAQTGDAYAYLTTNLGSLGANATAADDSVMTRLGNPAGASVSADIAAVEGQTDDIGAAGAGLTAADDAVIAAIAALNDITTAEVRDLVIEDQGSVTLGCAIAVVLAYAAGDLATTGADSTYEDPSGTETRATGTVASAGNRTAAITCPTY
jgi:hypothetical protein